MKAGTATGEQCQLSWVKLNTLMLQETHCSADNETDWQMSFLSHGTNFSAGVTFLFIHCLALTNILAWEVEQGTVLEVQATINNILCLSMWLLHKLNNTLKHSNSFSIVNLNTGMVVILLGISAWRIPDGAFKGLRRHRQRCVSSVSRRLESRRLGEGHPPSASTLSKIVKENDFVDV